ncbi:hypothetical protein cyc_06357 [Cyclospora cayetanensis]|uniref:Cleavage stimulation factor 50 kDa subunit n=1 Tax=Cyclospora cayetanensis TaxID=88456 RepID=A0A1D3DAN5_9EIME|nr:hypothetical protein cyc_06357 [Cyclospora cayetanensis]
MDICMKEELGAPADAAKGPSVTPVTPEGVPRVAPERDSHGSIQAGEESAPKEVDGQKAIDPTLSLHPLKVSFYEAVAKQLLDDELHEVAVALCGALRVRANVALPPDLLFSIYKAAAFQPSQEVAGAAAALTAQNLLLGGSPPDSDPATRGITGGSQESMSPSCSTQGCVSAACNGDMSVVVAGALDGSVRLLPVKSGRETPGATVGGPPSSSPPGGVAAGNARVLQKHDGPVSSVVLSPDSRICFSGSSDSTVKLFDISATKAKPAGGPIATLRDVFPITCLSAHPCGEFLYAGTTHPIVRLYDLQTLRAFASLRAPGVLGATPHQKGPLTDIKPSQDGTVLAVANFYFLRGLMATHEYGMYGEGNRQRPSLPLSLEEVSFELEILSSLDPYRPFLFVMTALYLRQEDHSVSSAPTQEPVFPLRIPTHTGLSGQAGFALWRPPLSAFLQLPARRMESMTLADSLNYSHVYPKPDIPSFLH